MEGGGGVQRGCKRSNNIERQKTAMKQYYVGKFQFRTDEESVGDHLSRRAVSVFGSSFCVRASRIPVQWVCARGPLASLSILLLLLLLLCRLVKWTHKYAVGLTFLLLYVFSKYYVALRIHPPLCYSGDPAALDEQKAVSFIGGRYCTARANDIDYFSDATININIYNVGIIDCLVYTCIFYRGPTKCEEKKMNGSLLLWVQTVTDTALHLFLKFNF